MRNLPFAVTAILLAIGFNLPFALLAVALMLFAPWLAFSTAAWQRRPGLVVGAAGLLAHPFFPARQPL